MVRFKFEDGTLHHKIPPQIQFLCQKIFKRLRLFVQVAQRFAPYDFALWHISRHQVLVESAVLTSVLTSRSSRPTRSARGVTSTISRSSKKRRGICPNLCGVVSCWLSRDAVCVSLQFKYLYGIVVGWQENGGGWYRVICDM